MNDIDDHGGPLFHDNLSINFTFECNGRKKEFLEIVAFQIPVSIRMGDNDRYDLFKIVVD